MWPNLVTSIFLWAHIVHLQLSIKIYNSNNDLRVFNLSESFYNFFVLLEDAFEIFDSTLENREVKSRENVWVSLNCECFVMFCAYTWSWISMRAIFTAFVIFTTQICVFMMSSLSFTIHILFDFCHKPWDITYKWRTNSVEVKE